MSMNGLRNMKIKKKITVSYTLCNILLLIICIYSILMIALFGMQYQRIYSEYGVASGEVGNAQGYYYHTLVDIGKMFQPGTTQSEIDLYVTDCNETISGMMEKLSNAVAGIDDSIIKQNYEGLGTALTAMGEEASELLGYASAGRISEANAIYNSESFMAYENEITEKFETLYDNIQAAGSTTIEDIAINRQASILIAIVAVIISVVLIVFIAKVVSFSLKLPAWNMCVAAKKMSEGDIDVDIKHMYNDELGELADDLIVMAANIKKQADIAKEVAHGNFCIDIKPTSEKDVMGKAICMMLNEENRVMTGISEAVSEIRTGSEQVASASQSLAQGSTEQASAIEQITASINEITERTKVNASDANEANNLVIQAKDDAQVGNGKMHDMIDAMTEINDSSENISKIIKVIDDIAFQTNILALNAAVEAARAGQHGKGFAVVADEVRNLAGKSAQAASETAEMIENSIAKVAKGSKLAEETAAALDGIVKAIDRIVHLTNSIAVASNDQATAITQIDQAINQVSQVVQTNSATSEQCAAASEELSAQAGKLREMISRYKLKKTVRDYNYSNEDSYTERREEKMLTLEDQQSSTPVIRLDDGFGKY